MFKFLLLKTRTPFIASSISNVRLMHDRKLPSIKNYEWSNDKNKKRIGTISPNKGMYNSNSNKIIENETQSHSHIIISPKSNK